MPSVAVDASVIVRYLTGDDAVQSPAAAELFRAAARGKLRLVVPASTIQETVYVLEKLYHLDPVEIAPKLISLLAIPNVDIPEARFVLDALQSYRNRKCDFGDALLCAYAVAEEYGVATFDKGLMRKFPEVSAHTPREWVSKL